MWKYTSNNSYPDIILHDCKIERIRLDRQDMVFEFDDYGFWIAEGNTQNPFNKLLRTGKAELRLTNIDLDFLSMSVYNDLRFVWRKLFTTKKEIALDDFAAKINSGIWTFEFKDEYYGYKCAMFCGCIHTNKMLYLMDMQIEIPYEESQYSWNKIYEDRPW